MHSLRRRRHLTVAVLAWFVLSLGVALLAPAFAGDGLPDGICSVDSGKPDSGPLPSHVVHCPACVHTAAPPPADVVAVVHLHAPASTPAVPADPPPPKAPPARWTARGPPSLS